MRPARDHNHTPDASQHVAQNMRWRRRLSEGLSYGLHQVLIAGGALLVGDGAAACGASIHVIAGSADNNSSPDQALQADTSARTKTKETRRQATVRERLACGMLGRWAMFSRPTSTYILATVSTVDDLNSSDILDLAQIHLPPCGAITVCVRAGATPPAPIKAVPVDRPRGISIPRHR